MSGENLGDSAPGSGVADFRTAQQEMYQKKPTMGTFTYSTGKGEVIDAKPFTRVGKEIVSPKMEEEAKRAEELIVLGEMAEKAGMEIQDGGVVISNKALKSLLKNERAVFKEIIAISTELATKEAALVQLYASTFLSDEDKASLLEHVNPIITSLEKCIEQNTEDPNSESTAEGNTLLSSLGEKIAAYTKIHESLKTADALRKEESTHTKTSPIATSSKAEKGKPVTEEPLIQEPEPVEPSLLQARDVADITPHNISRGTVDSVIEVRKPDGSVEPLTGKGLHAWIRARRALKEYRDLVESKKIKDVSNLALIKDRLLLAIENERWGKESAVAFYELLEALDEAKKKYIAETTGAPLTSSTSATPEPALATATEDEPATAPTAPPLPPKPPTPPHTVDPPEEPEPAPKPKDTEPAPSTPEKKSLDIWSTWPSYIYFEKGKDSGKWVFTLDGKKEYLPDNDMWSTEEANLKPVFAAYVQFLRGTNSTDQAAKIKKCTSLIEAKNAVIEALKEKDIVKAGVCREILAQELSEWQEKWPLLVEQGKLAQTFEAKKKVYLQEMNRAGNLQKELTSALEKEHIEREWLSLDTMFKRVEIAAENNTLTSKDLELLESATVRITSLLNTYDEKLTKVMTPSLTNREATPLYRKKGLVLRSTIATPSNKDQKVSRIGKPDTTVGKWQEEQDTALEEKEQITSMTEVQNIQDMMERHKIMYDRNPKGYIATYRYKEFDHSDPERAIVREIMKDAKDVLTPQEIIRLDKEHFAQQSKVTSLERASSSYSPRRDAVEQIKNPREAAAQEELTEKVDELEEKRKEEKITDKEHQDALEKILQERKESVPLREALHNGGMTGPKNAYQQPMAITNPEKKSPEVKLEKVSKLMETKMRTRRTTWLMLSTPLWGWGLSTVDEAPEVPLAPQQIESTITKSSENSEWAAKYLQTEDSKEMKKSLSLSGEELVKKYVSSADPLFATSLLKSSASAIFYDNDSDVVEGVTDQKGKNHRKEISNFLLLLQQVSQATTAPLRAEDVKNTRGYSLDAYDMIPKNSPITIGQYITEVKRKMGEADKREGK